MSPWISMKHGDSFLLADRCGDVPADGEGGFYVGGTRHLSALELRVGGLVPPLLSSSLADDDATLSATQTNPELLLADGTRVGRHGVLIARELAVAGGRLHARITVESYRREPLPLTLTLRLDADFADLFEVRGFRRSARGERLEPRTQGDALTFTYRGLDEVVRRTEVRFAPAPARLDGTSAAFERVLAPHTPWVIEVVVAGGLAGLVEGGIPDTPRAAARVRREIAAWERGALRVFTSSDALNALLERAAADVRLLCTRTTEGWVPYAGIPWYACPFGRDALWTAWMTLPLAPKIASGTLRFLARHQATGREDFTDAEPGKILHELRTGEMANLREIPFIPYYGSADATPLFVTLLERYVAWTGDADLADALWESALAALAWIRGAGDPDGDGFVEYLRRSSAGLTHQGWKDSGDSIFHADGTAAEGPIALVEVQGYVYAALLAGGRLARLRGEAALAAELEAEAAALKERFDGRFWSDRVGTYALALDGRKARCEVSTSNAGHALWAGIVDDAKAARVARRLLGKDLFSGWGVRTLSDAEVRYNPMAYHNGSVWPHDNAIVADGLRRYGFHDEAARVATAILEASMQFEDVRVPELFCGFPRAPRHPPVPYPVACRPQAWSAAAIFHLVTTMLGLEVDGVGQRVLFVRPSLPPSIAWIELTDLAAGAKRAHVRLARTKGGGAVVVRASGDAKVRVK